MGDTEPKSAADLLVAKLETLRVKENGLYVKLENERDTGNQAAIREEIKKVYNDRAEIMTQLLNVYKAADLSTAGLEAELTDVMTVLTVLKDQTALVKRGATELETEQRGVLRQAEINTYYGNKTRAETTIMKVVAAIFVCILAFLALAKFKVIPAGLVGTLSLFIIVIGVGIIFWYWSDLQARSNMVFDEYDWEFNEKDYANAGASSGSSWWDSQFGFCYDSDCCGTYDDTGTRYYPTVHQCLSDDAAKKRMLCWAEGEQFFAKNKNKTPTCQKLDEGCPNGVINDRHICESCGSDQYIMEDNNGRYCETCDEGSYPVTDEHGIRRCRPKSG